MVATPRSPSLCVKAPSQEERTHSTAPHTPRSTSTKKTQFIRLTQRHQTATIRPLQQLKKLHSQNLQPSRILPLEDLIGKGRPKGRQHCLRQRLKGAINIKNVVIEVPPRTHEKEGRMWESVPLSRTSRKENQNECPQSPIHRLLDGSMVGPSHLNYHH